MEFPFVSYCFQLDKIVCIFGTVSLIFDEVFMKKICECFNI